MANLSVLGIVLAVILIGISLALYGFTLGEEAPQTRMAALITGILGLLLIVMSSSCYSFSCTST